MDTDNKDTAKEWPLKKWLDAFGNIFGLNVCFLIGSIPIFTIGASVTALYAMCIHLQEGEEETVSAGFIREYKRNFKQATIMFLLMVVAAVVLYVEFLLVNNVSGGIGIFYSAVLFIEGTLFALTVPFAFPLLARYENTVLGTLKNSLILAFGYLGSWLKVALAWFAPIALTIIYPTIFLAAWYLYLLIIFGAIAYGSSFTMRKVFRLNAQAIEKTAEGIQDEEQDDVPEEELQDDEMDDVSEEKLQAEETDDVQESEDIQEKKPNEA